MKKLLFYSHDTYGLGNIRRTMSICRFLMASIPDLSILIVSGSPMVHSFRIPDGIDYVKLPCLTRTGCDGYTSKFLDDEQNSLLKLRADIIHCSTANFKPDLVIVDKKPYGVQNELQPALAYIREHLPQTKLTLLLRDILDNPDVTRQIWEKHGFYDALREHYHEIFVLGSPEVFDPREEYRFPFDLRRKTRFCGYLRREAGLRTRSQVRAELNLRPEDPFVVVTAGGGEDGTQLFHHYLSAMQHLSCIRRLHSLLVLGPEMPAEARATLMHRARQFPNILTMEFTDDLMSYLNAADVVVSMAGYGTVCEILSLNKHAVVVPRVRPVEEQWIRAQRMAKLGVFTALHPDTLTPQALAHHLRSQLEHEPTIPPAFQPLNLDALPCLTMAVLNLFMNAQWKQYHPLQPARRSTELHACTTESPSFPHAYGRVDQW